jgi:hypothetical protein
MPELALPPQKVVQFFAYFNRSTHANAALSPTAQGDSSNGYRPQDPKHQCRNYHDLTGSGCIPPFITVRPPQTQQPQRRCHTTNTVSDPPSGFGHILQSTFDLMFVSMNKDGSHTYTQLSILKRATSAVDCPSFIFRGPKPNSFFWFATHT